MRRRPPPVCAAAGGASLTGGGGAAPIWAADCAGRGGALGRRVASPIGGRLGDGALGDGAGGGLTGGAEARLGSAAGPGAGVTGGASPFDKAPEWRSIVFSSSNSSKSFFSLGAFMLVPPVRVRKAGDDQSKAVRYTPIAARPNIRETTVAGAK
jgi:hypothetical protein